ncbi:MAG: alpha-glucan family phosphorylase, partial [Proteobacteria bacterium]|nr:alpha-glucan family phosphorylase [Pseudomonadota bacterium]
PLDARVCLELESRSVWVGAWLYVERNQQGQEVPVILLDTDLQDNSPEDRRITHLLYGGDERNRLKQEAVLGIGGVRILAALGFTVLQFHLNEGHSALLALELLRRCEIPERDRHAGESPYDLPRVREQCSFTTHTPVEAGHDHFPYTLVRAVLGDFIDQPLLESLGGPMELNLTRLALATSECVNGVTQRHAETSRRRFPGVDVHAITNGVHVTTWVCPELAPLFDQHVPRWRQEPEFLARADCCLPPQALWSAHVAAKKRLVAQLARNTGVSFDPELPLIGFARRMTQYKRAELLFQDPGRLRAIARRQPFQLVFGGKAHPQDADGRDLLKTVIANLRALAPDVRAVYVADYDLASAQALVSGVDLWLNTPLPPFEASGTSGMKAALNGVPSLSVLDGWWLEGCIEGVTGWSIGSGDAQSTEADAVSLYAKLEDVVLPLYRHDTPGWIRVMLGAIAKNGSIFNSHRMMRRYATDAYLR